MTRIARAQWRPLPQNATARVIRPRLIIVHTQVGNLKGTESWFKNSRAQGTESTFGIGGPWDGPDVDGDIYQWMDTHRQADCNLAANAISVSIEMADGGDPRRPMSPKQLSSLTALIVDLCRAEGIPPTLARAWDGSGLGYHQLFVPQWNRTHDCPGTLRRAQLRNLVFPAVAAAMKPKPAPKPQPATDTGGSPMALTDQELKTLRNQTASTWNQVGGAGTDDKRPLVVRVNSIEAKLDQILAALTPTTPENGAPQS